LQHSPATIKIEENNNKAAQVPEIVSHIEALKDYVT
jgi:hypothetical protein